jgi:hypothetical protein
MIQYPPNCFEQNFTRPQNAALEGPPLASSTNKKVYVQRFDREPLMGFVNPVTYLTHLGIELLQRSGIFSVIPYSEIKGVYFVRDFPSGEPTERRTFLSRPKLEGVWLRLIFRDQDALEGIIQNNLLSVDPTGFLLIPPDSTQRVFVPRAALLEVQVLGVVGSPLRGDRRKKPPAKEQIGLFEEQA